MVLAGFTLGGGRGFYLCGKNNPPGGALQLGGGVLWEEVWRGCNPPGKKLGLFHLLKKKENNNFFIHCLRNYHKTQ